MKAPIAVIIPSYNRAHLLPRAIDSVLRQRLPAAEMVVVDDGSEDETPAVLRGYGQQIRVLQQPNRGVSAARNAGIAATTAPWIALLDSDDEWLPGKLAAQWQLLSQQPQLRICHGEEIWIRHGKRVNPMKKHANSGGRIYCDSLPRCVISPSAVVLQRSLLEQVGLFDETLPACEDYDLWLRICARETVGFVSDPLLIKYGGHADQLSRLHWGMDRFRVTALRKRLDDPHLTPEERQATRCELQRKGQILAQGAAKRGEQGAAEYYQRLALTGESA